MFNKWLSGIPEFSSYQSLHTFSEMSRLWYLEVGVNLVLLFLFMILIRIVFYLLVSYIPSMFKYLRYKSKRVMLNYVLFKIPLKLDILSFLFSIIALLVLTFMLSSGIPVLSVLTCVIIWFFYWICKLIFVSRAFIPSEYTKVLYSSIMRILELALFVHLLFSIYIINNPDSFATFFELKSSSLSINNEIMTQLIKDESNQSNLFETFGNRIKQNYIFLILLLLLILYLILDLIFFSKITNNIFMNQFKKIRNKDKAISNVNVRTEEKKFETAQENKMNVDQDGVLNMENIHLNREIIMRNKPNYNRLVRKILNLKLLEYTNGALGSSYDIAKSIEYAKVLKIWEENKPVNA